MSLMKLRKGTYIDPTLVSFMCIDKVEQVSGPALIRSKVVVNGAVVTLSNEETLALEDYLKAQGLLEIKND